MRTSSIVLFSVFVCVHAWAADEFNTIKCGADIPKAMVGKHSSNERVVVTEARHSNLGLKDLGGVEISDRLFLISWRICGGEYAVLLNTEKDVVRDILPVPVHSLQSPHSFAEGCQVASRDIPNAVIAILDNSKGQRPKTLPRPDYAPGQDRLENRRTPGTICPDADTRPNLRRKRFQRRRQAIVHCWRKISISPCENISSSSPSRESWPEYLWGGCYPLCQGTSSSCFL
jgi:hypothetical protein